MNCGVTPSCGCVFFLRLCCGHGFGACDNVGGERLLVNVKASLNGHLAKLIHSTWQLSIARFELVFADLQQ